MAKPIPPHLNQSRLKTTLKMAISKLKFVQEKKTAITKQQRRQLSELLSQGKESSAKIRVENIIRDDIYIELLEYLELYCELLLARLAILLDRPTCETNLAEAVSSVIYAANHTELKELIQIKDILMFKFGNEFLTGVLENKDGQVPEKIVKRCDIEPPSEVLVDLYLCEIAKAYSVPYSGLSLLEVEEEKKEEDDDDEGSDGGTKELAEPIGELADKPSVKKLEPKPKLKDQDEFDALRARFAALKGTTP
ncbi:Vacuolar protein sorting-associated protein IST1 [Candida viswanathii]|uniref:Vacuolar protein sorting-associated protein IST1 n=1 Tax=Candida viswanathii TaxID=5486 RepID=A0A367XN70_9ASCO|nr:Vacuolar protein sorting-associated protein IST1 [Candida viswanathii]